MTAISQQPVLTHSPASLSIPAKNKPGLRLANVNNGVVSATNVVTPPVAKTTPNAASARTASSLESPRPGASRLYSRFYDTTFQAADPHARVSDQEDADYGTPLGADVAGMTTFGNIDRSDPPELSGTLRRQMAEVGATSGVDALHAQAVDEALSAAKQRIDRDMQAAAVHLQRENRQPSRARDVYSGAQIAQSRNLIATAVARFCNAEKSREQYLAALEEHGANRGGEMVRIACLALALPCAADPGHGELVKQLEKDILAYLKVDKGDLHATQKTWGGGGAKQCDAIRRSLEKLTSALGRERIGTDIMVALAPALLDGLERSGHPVTHRSLAAALNPQALGAFLKLTERPDMLLRMADTLPKLLRAAHGEPTQPSPPSTPPPASPTASPTAASAVSPAAPVIHYHAPVFKAPKYQAPNYQAPNYQAPNYPPPGNVAPSHDEREPGGPRVDPWLRDNAGARRTSASSRASSTSESSTSEFAPSSDAIDLDDLYCNVERSQHYAPATPLTGNTIPPPPNDMFDEPPRLMVRERLDHQSTPAVTPSRTESVGEEAADRLASRTSPRRPGLYMNMKNPGLKQPQRTPNAERFTLNLSTERNNVRRSNILVAQGPMTEDGTLPVVVQQPHAPKQVNHRGRGAERDGTVRVVPEPFIISVPRSP